MANGRVRDTSGVPPWEARESSWAPASGLPGLDMATLPTRGSREAREWCEAWLEEWLEAGGHRARIGQHPADWDHWWTALRRRGMGRALGLGRFTAFEYRAGRNKKIMDRVANRIPLVLEQWRPGTEHVQEYPVPDAWWEWWTQELGNDLRMLACLYERAMIQSMGRACFEALRTELRLYAKIAEYQDLWPSGA